LNPKS
jgi:transposase-like protein